VSNAVIVHTTAGYKSKGHFGANANAHNARNSSKSCQRLISENSVGATRHERAKTRRWQTTGDRREITFPTNSANTRVCLSNSFHQIFVNQILQPSGAPNQCFCPRYAKSFSVVGIPKSMLVIHTSNERRMLSGYQSLPGFFPQTRLVYGLAPSRQFPRYQRFC